MFYYGLDFHDLAPNFILNISAFIVVCKWMVSSVTEGHIKKLRKAGYLSNDIALPASRKGAAPPHPKAP